MTGILSAIGTLVTHVATVVPKWLSLFFIEVPQGGGNTVTAVTPIGLFCLVLPLVGLGIGIIRRLVKIRA